MAFLQLLSDGSPYIQMPVSGSCSLKLDADPVLVTAPITTVLPDRMSDDAEEQDLSTIGNFDVENDE
jgi:hypothetical protein